MKRGRPSTVRAVSKRAGKATAIARLDQKSKTIERLTARFLQLAEQLARDAVETMREMGEVLEEGKKILGGSYTAWVTEDLGASTTAARNYVRVLELSRTTPDVFIQSKDLGPSKIIRLGRVAPGKRKTVLKTKVAGKNVADMTDAEFAGATRPYLGKSRRVTGNMKGHGLRMKVRAMADALSKAHKAFPKIENPRLKKELRAELQRLAKAVQALTRRAR